MRNVKQNFGRVLTLALLLMMTTVAWAQQRITGTVTDSKGEALIGVSVVEAGTTNGATTNIDGQFTLNVKPGARLNVSYIGYNTQTVAARNGMTVTLQEDNQLLDEVVVVGYGTMRRKDVTSSITTVQAKDLNQGVFTDPASLLQGKVAGLTVTTTGDPNGTPSITLRGASSLREGAAMEPYYVIDGIPGVDISMVAPDDIESIDVLRDASATAIYGSKAANGVIIITTKSGQEGRTNVTYNGYVAFDRIAKTLDMATADDIRNYVNANGIDYAYDKGGDTDWQDEVLRTGISHNHNVSINGGAGKTKYMASANYMNREGVIDGTHMNRLNVRSLISSSILKDHLDVSVGMNMMYGKHVGVPMGYFTDGRGSASVLDAMNYFNPTSPIRNADGSWTAGDGSANYNPVSMINEDLSETMWKRNQFIGKATLHIIEGLDWNANYSFSNRQSTYSSYRTHNTQITPYNDYNGTAERNTYLGDDQTFETYLNYDVTIAKAHKLALMAGYSWEERNSNDGFGFWNHNYFDDYLKWNNMSYAGVMDGQSAVQSGTKETVRNISFYGRLSYSYNSRYMLQATIRRDGSSVFAPGHRWGTFPSVSVAWNIAEESFMKGSIFDQLKLRAGYGISGNAIGFGAYSGVPTYGVFDAYGNYRGTFTYQGKSWAILGATKLANPDLKWESTAMFNVGLDYAFWNNRINGSIEFYNKKTKDLIWKYPVSPVIYPYGEIQANVGEITNRGVEFTINIDAIRTKNFNWMTTINLAHNKNTVDKLSNDKFQTSTFAQGEPHVAGVSANGYTQRVMEGEPIGTFFLYEFAGYDDSGKASYYVRDDNGNKTGEVTNAPEYKDRYVAGNAQPKLNFGWNNTFTYKNWSATAFFTGVLGNKIYNSSRAHYTAPDFFAGGKNVLKEFITDRPATDNLSNIPSDRFLEKGDYFRLASLTLGYTFRNLGGWAESLQLYGTANNLFTITGYKGIDPEVNMGGIAPGVDYRWSNYPHTRTYMVGVKINFGGGKAAKAGKPVVQYVDREVVREVPTVKEVVKEVPGKDRDVLVQNTYVVTFAQNSAEISNETELSGIKKGSNVEVVAYASPEGNNDANQRLSQERADAVAKYLKDKGVNVTRVVAKGADTTHANRIAIVTVK